jgi:hypothetical protein
MHLTHVGLLKTALACLCLSIAPPKAQDGQRELADIEAELKREYKELRAATREADDDEAVEALYHSFQRDVLPEFAERFARVARAEKGQPVAFEAWGSVLELAQQGLTGAVALEAMNTLVADFATHEGLDALAMTLRYSAPGLGEEAVAKALSSMAERTPHRTVKAAALFNLGALLGEERAAGDPKLAEAKLVFAKLSDFKDVEMYEGRSYADAAQAFVFALENLVPGKPCPDFSAVDAEGAAFKLSDYKGKVVLVDFWGFW